MSARADLIKKLQEIFQTDRADLDFGIYKILNSRADEINRYLGDTLPAQIQAALQNNDAQETAVYNHLLTFFSRYYDTGDFISQRRYKGNTYAIPYNGEEVLLHWANKDQYYTKSGENFSNYRFTLADGKQVFFKLVQADTAKDNQKDNEKARLFVLAQAREAEYNDEGEEIRPAVVPVAESSDGQTLTVSFEYKTFAKTEKQNTHSEAALAAIQSHPAVQQHWAALFERAPTDKNPNRTVLEKHLNDYTQKNSADYFIHKDLGGFLKRELDFYIKNEVMDLDNIQQAGSFERILDGLKQIQTLRHIAHSIIAFLAQLENFQKKLWLKKKFVVGNHYLITLDRIPAAFHDEIFANPKQAAAWQNLFSFNTLENCGGVNLVESNTYKHLVVDTSLFPAGFQTRLLSALSTGHTSLDTLSDGLIIHADNFQALNLLQARYREQVKCIYIDPPYNTGEDGFIYKDNYQHSSWLSLMNDRIHVAYPLMTKDSALFCQISDLENTNLNKLMVSIFGEENNRETISVITSSKSGVNAINVKRGERLFKIKEYVHFYSKHPSFRFHSFYTPDLYNTNYCWEIYQNSDRTWHVSNLKKDKNFNDAELEKYALSHPEHIYSIEKNNSKAGEGMKTMLEKSKLTGNVEVFTDQFGVSKLLYDGGVCVGLAERVIQEGGKNYFGVLGSDIWDDIGQASKSEGGVSFCNGKKPEKLLKRIIEMTTQPNDLVLDYFSGSGTTVNVAQKLKRKWIGIEQGEYFNSVLLARIQKTLYGLQTGISKSINYQGGGFVKVLKLESYEDTLNNLQLAKPQGLDFSDGLRQDYLLHYMLDVESRGSLLNTSHFAKPFDYRMNIAADSAGAYVETPVDLVETFNYLLGLRVEAVDDKRFSDGYVLLEGRLKNERVLLVWRDCEKWDYETLPKLLAKKRVNPQDSEYAAVYINGDHTLPTAWQSDDGSENRSLKILPIEAEFLRLMFEGAE